MSLGSILYLYNEPSNDTGVEDLLKGRVLLVIGKLVNKQLTYLILGTSAVRNQKTTKQFLSDRRRNKSERRADNL